MVEVKDLRPGNKIIYIYDDVENDCCAAAHGIVDKVYKGYAIATMKEFDDELIIDDNNCDFVVKEGE